MARTPGSLENYALPPEDSPDYALCRWFRLPLIHTDKPTMTRMAEERGWMPVLRHTWFCHKPVMGRYACGTCRPCVYLMDRGQFFRMGRLGKLRFYTLEKGQAPAARGPQGQSPPHGGAEAAPFPARLTGGSRNLWRRWAFAQN